MRRSSFLLLLGLCLGATGARAQGDPAADARREAYAKAGQSIDADLEKAVAELAKVRETIRQEKPPLAKESNAIAADLREKRRLSELARTSREAAESGFAKTENELKIWRDERQYIEGLLFEFRKASEAKQSLARNELNRELLDAPTSAGHLALLESTIAHLKEIGKVETVKGEAISDDGAFIPGTFAEAGPVSWFLSDDGFVSGLVSVNADMMPLIVPGTEQPGPIGSVLRGERSSLRFDPTMGTAVALDETKRTLVEHVKEGGFWMIPILLLGVVSFTTALIKWAQLSRVRDFSQQRVHEVLDHLHRDEPARAREAIAKVRHPAKKVLERGIDIVSSGSPFSKEGLEEALYEKYIEAVPRLQRGLALLSVAAGAGPLLGLLATVTGIMKTFRLITIFGSGDAKPLASGISESLIGTEYGLIVAIPSLIAYALMSRKIHGIKDAMELTSLAFINGLRPDRYSEEGPVPRTAGKPTAKAEAHRPSPQGGSAEALA